MDSPTFSIVIPTAFDKGPLLKTCVQSIQEFSDFSEIEIIVVANGVTDDSADWALANGCVVLAFEKAIGYPAAVNAGIANAKGEFVVLLNNDTKVLGRGWLETLREPFACASLTEAPVAVSGPMKEHCAHAGHDFILFFCACIRRSVFERIGVLDEVFSPGYSEDVDFCCRAQKAGYRVAQVPDDKSHDYYDVNKRTGSFPIFHAGNETFKDHPDTELITRNAAVVAERYGAQLTNVSTTGLIKRAVGIDAAKAICGALSDNELSWLAQQARESKIIIECGSLFGRSTRALADAMLQDGILYAIDTWRGSKEEDDMRAHAALLDGDQDFNIFTRNLWDHIEAGRVVPLRMNGRHAAKLLKDMGVQADLVFIDAGHAYEEVREDIQSFRPLVKPNGLLSGHDYFTVGEPPWIQVRKAVDEVLSRVELCDTIWATRESPKTFATIPEEPRGSKVFDCFLFGGELDILERRLSTMWDYVDRFTIVEGTKTHGGEDKTLVFHNNLPRFQRFLSKITYIVVEDWPQVTKDTPDWSWVYERHQRDAIMRGLSDYFEDDVIIISDCDEIPNPEVIARFRPSGMKIAALEMELYVYDEKTLAVDPWREARIMLGKWLKRATPCQARYTQCPAISDGGIHLSWQGGIDAIIEKIKRTAHQELNTEEFKDRVHVERCIREGLDLFNRPNIKFRKTG